MKKLLFFLAFLLILNAFLPTPFLEVVGTACPDGVRNVHKTSVVCLDGEKHEILPLKR